MLRPSQRLLDCSVIALLRVVVESRDGQIAGGFTFNLVLAAHFHQGAAGPGLALASAVLRIDGQLGIHQGAPIRLAGFRDGYRDFQLVFLNTLCRTA